MRQRAAEVRLVPTLAPRAQSLVTIQSAASTPGWYWKVSKILQPEIWIVPPPPPEGRGVREESGIIPTLFLRFFSIVWGPRNVESVLKGASSLSQFYTDLHPISNHTQQDFLDGASFFLPSRSIPAHTCPDKSVRTPENEGWMGGVQKHNRSTLDGDNIRGWGATRACFQAADASSHDCLLQPVVFFLPPTPRTSIVKTDPMGGGGGSDIQVRHSSGVVEKGL